jgi:hypothetical protein
LRDGLRLTPLKVEVEVTRAPVDGVQFSQSLATLHGTVKCISEDCGSITVHVTSAASTLTAEVHSGIWRLSGILPGEYKVKVATCSFNYFFIGIWSGFVISVVQGKGCNLQP